MALSQGQLTVILDKASRYAGLVVGDTQLNPSFTAGMQYAGLTCLSGANGFMTWLMAETPDEDILGDLADPFRELDENNPQPTDLKLTSLTKVMAIFTALDRHYVRLGYKSLDDYLTSLNGPKGMTPTLRIHQHFKRYYGKLSSQNLFTPVDVDLATYTIGAGTPLAVNGSLSLSGTNGCAGAKIVVKNVGALTTSAVISVVAVKIDGTVATLTATLSTHTDAHETDLSDTAKLYASIQSITITSSGTNADVFKIVAKTDRSIIAA